MSRKWPQVRKKVFVKIGRPGEYKLRSTAVSLSSSLLAPAVIHS